MGPVAIARAPWEETSPRKLRNAEPTVRDVWSVKVSEWSIWVVCVLDDG